MVGCLSPNNDDLTPLYVMTSQKWMDLARSEAEKDDRAMLRIFGAPFVESHLVAHQTSAGQSLDERCQEEGNGHVHTKEHN